MLLTSKGNYKTDMRYITKAYALAPTNISRKLISKRKFKQQFCTTLMRVLRNMKKKTVNDLLADRYNIH